MAITSVDIRRQLTPRLFFDGALAGCTIGLGTVLAVEALGALSLSGQGRGQVLGFAAAILLCVIGVLFGDGVRRGDLGRGVATLVTLSLSLIFALACVPIAAAAFGMPVQSQILWLGAWNAAISGTLAWISLAMLRGWSH